MTAVGLYGAALIVGAISSAFPLVSAEVFMAGIAVAKAEGRTEVLAIAFLCAFGHMVAKIPMFYGARSATRLAKPDGRVAKVKGWIARWKNKKLLTLLSATTGIPPFYVIALLAGMLEMRFRTFLLIGFGGRFARFTVIGMLAFQV